MDLNNIGLQRQPKPFSPTGKPIVTVEGVLTNALKQLQPANDFKITLSSRTDRGVHSLRNACHVDLQYPETGKEFIPEVITNVANFHLKSQKHDVRILETRRVSDHFHARFWARERRYIYRIAHTVGQHTSELEEQVKADKEMFLEQLANYSFGPNEKYQRLPFGQNLLILDAERIKAYRQKLDIGKLIKAAELLSGVHNFSSFTRRISQQSYFPHPVKLMTIGVKRGLPIGHHMFTNMQYLVDNLEYWDIHVRAHSFLFRQVRRMVGAMVLVAKGILTLEDLQDALDKPRRQVPISSFLGMDEFGLFLTDVVYKPEDLHVDAPSKVISPNVLSHSEEDGQVTNSNSCHKSSDSNLSSQRSESDEISQQHNTSSFRCLPEETRNPECDFVPYDSDNLSVLRNLAFKR